MKHEANLSHVKCHRQIPVPRIDALIRGDENYTGNATYNGNNTTSEVKEYSVCHKTEIKQCPIAKPMELMASRQFLAGAVAAFRLGRRPPSSPLPSCLNQYPVTWLELLEASSRHPPNPSPQLCERPHRAISAPLREREARGKCVRQIAKGGAVGWIRGGEC